jgi:hypothetical protein
MVRALAEARQAVKALLERMQVKLGYFVPSPLPCLPAPPITPLLSAPSFAPSLAPSGRACQPVKRSFAEAVEEAGGRVGQAGGRASQADGSPGSQARPFGHGG